MPPLKLSVGLDRVSGATGKGHMTGDGAKYAILKEEEKPLLLAYCSRHLVGFISDGDADFYGSGVIINVNSTWAIATAAHVVTKIARSSGVRVIFPGRQSDLGPRPVAAREYHPLCAVVSDPRGGRDWRPETLDLGVIVPTQDVFAGIPDIAAINLRLREPNPRVVTGRFCIVAGFPHRLQDQRDEMVVTTNAVSSHFVACPTGARPDDIAVNWTEVFQITSGQHEGSPDAGGMSGGPVFAYIDDLGDASGLHSGNSRSRAFSIIRASRAGGIFSPIRRRHFGSSSLQSWRTPSRITSVRRSPLGFASRGSEIRTAQPSTRLKAAGGAGRAHTARGFDLAPPAH